MNAYDKFRLYLITISIDIPLIYLLFTTTTTLLLIDQIWIITVLLTHLIFFYSLYYNNRNILDQLHYLVFILPCLSLYCTHLYIQIVSTMLLCVIQVLWIIEERCILNDNSKKKFGYGKQLNIFTLLLSIILSIKIGQNI